MQKRNIILIKQVILLLLSLCLFPEQTLAQGIIKNERALKTFTGIEASKNIEVFISQGDTIKVVVETAEDIQQSVVTEVSGETLKLTTNDRSMSLTTQKAQISIYVTLPALNHLLVTTNSRAVITSDFEIDNLDLTVSSSGLIDIHNQLNIADKLTINGKTKGKIISKDVVTAGAAGITVASGGNVNMLLNISSKLECMAIDNSIVSLTGKAEDALLSAKSKSELKLKHLKLERANVVATSSAIVYVNANEFLAATAADRAIINYSGKPRSISKETTTGGKIK